MTKTIEELQAQRIEELETRLEVATDECIWFATKNHQLQAENKSLKEDIELTEVALHREVEEHAKASASMRKFHQKNVELTSRLKSIENHLLYMYRHNTLEAAAELKKPQDDFSFNFYTIKLTESIVAQSTLLNFFDYDYLQLRKMV